MNEVSFLKHSKMIYVLFQWESFDLMPLSPLLNPFRDVKKQRTIRAMLFWVESEMPQDPLVFRFLGEMSSAWGTDISCLRH
jgi:hypothetical protein